MSPTPNLRVIEARPAQAVAEKIAAARAEVAVALDDAVSCLQEGSRRAFEVVGVCTPDLIGVGRHARLQRLAAHVALELRQIAELPAP